MTELTLQKARDALERLAVDARQLTRWQTDAKTYAERIELGRLLAIIPEIRPLMQRQIALATERAVVAIVTSGKTTATGFRNG